MYFVAFFSGAFFKGRLVLPRTMSGTPQILLPARAKTPAPPYDRVRERVILPKSSVPALALTPCASARNLKYIMAVKTIRLGQVWRRDEDGQNYLVTRVFNEVFTQFAVLRPAEITAPDAPTTKVKVAKEGDGLVLPGYTFTQNE